MSDEILARLREAAHHEIKQDSVTISWDAFSPESVQRGLERMRTVKGCLNRPEPGVHCDACWAAMLDAFIQGVRDA